MSLYQIDQYGRAVIDSAGLFELWYQGQDETGLVVISDDAVRQFNEQCDLHDKSAFRIPEVEPEAVPHETRLSRWMIPEEFKTIDIEAYCLALCAADDEVERVRHEMVLFKQRGLVPLLQALTYMVSVFRENKIVWGIGRGSSVASFVLFLIGVHKIHPMKFGLDIEDFLR